MVKRTMNGKRLLILAAFAAFASFAMPAAFANTLSNTVNITVKWNTQALGTLVIHTNYLASSGLNNAAAQYVGATTGHGSCTATGGTNVDGTVDFGQISADPTVQTNCQFANAVNAIITTSDPNGYTLAEASSAALPTGYNLCLIKNGSWTNNTALPSNSSILPAGTAAAETATCSVGTAFAVGTTALGIVNNTGAGNSTAGTEIGMDVNLVIAAAAPVGAGTATVVYTLLLQ